MSDAVRKVQELLKLPQELCHMCGRCCRIATFKGGLSYEEVKKLAEEESDDPSKEGAKDFLAIFEPYETIEDAKEYAAEFVERVLERFGKDSKAGFFKCKFIGDDNKCKIHEDRPQLCRMYPIPHERTFYNPGCGFEEQGKKNWEEIVKIMQELESKKGQK